MSSDCFRVERVQHVMCICRATIQRIADALGVRTFVSRSYIELVQLLRLTQEFANVSDKAREHFDVIVDDHVIGSSPARKLVWNGAAHLRHSADATLRTVTSEPQRTLVGFQPSREASAVDSPRALPTPRDADDDSLLQAAASVRRAPSRTRLSREVDALDLDHSRDLPFEALPPASAPAGASSGVNGVAAAAAAAVASSRGHRRHAHADHAERSSSPAEHLRSGFLPPRPETPSIRHPSGLSAVHSDAASALNGTSNGTATQPAHAEKSDSTPWFWERRSGKPVDVAALAMDMRADLKALTHELRTAGRAMSCCTAAANVAAGAVAGFALGVVVTCMVLRLSTR